VVLLAHDIRHGADFGKVAAPLQAEFKKGGAFHGLHIIVHLPEAVVQLLDGIARRHRQEIQRRTGSRLPEQRCRTFAVPFGNHMHNLTDRRPAWAAAGDADIHDQVVIGASGKGFFQRLLRRICSPASAEERCRCPVGAGHDGRVGAGHDGRVARPGGAGGVQFKIDGCDK